MILLAWLLFAPESIAIAKVSISIVSIGSVVARVGIGTSIAIVVPGVSFRVSSRISFRSRLSLCFSLLTSPESISISIPIGSVSIISTIGIRSGIVVPGVSVGISIRVGYWGSFSLSLSFLTSPKTISISISVVPMAIVSTIGIRSGIVVPGVSAGVSIRVSHCLRVGLRGWDTEGQRQ